MGSSVCWFVHVHVRLALWYTEPDAHCRRRYLIVFSAFPKDQRLGSINAPKFLPSKAETDTLFPDFKLDFSLNEGMAPKFVQSLQIHWTLQCFCCKTFLVKNRYHPCNLIRDWLVHFPCLRLGWNRFGYPWIDEYPFWFLMSVQIHPVISLKKNTQFPLC